jgi:hypothetical protein
MNPELLNQQTSVIDIAGKERIRHRTMSFNTDEMIYIQEGELVGYDGENGQTVRSSARIAFSAYYRGGIFVRAVLHYSVQSFGYSVMAVLMVTYEDAGLTGGVMPIMRIRGGSPDRLGPVKLPPRFDGSMILNEAKMTVPPSISPSGNRYIVSVAMGPQVCTFLVPRTLMEIPANMRFSSSVQMAAMLEELTTETKQDAPKRKRGTKKSDP